jgi:alpha-ketoglutarate-dependent taurine dioxygenase
MHYHTIAVRPIAGAPGAEIHGVDLAQGLSNEQFAEIQRAFHDYSVLFFRDQHLTPEEHLAFTERWGAINVNRPETGRKALYVNPGFTVRFDGWTEEASRPLLEHLYRHATRPEFTCRFYWQQGSLAFWDNRATWHYALNDYQGQRRLLHRLTVEGVPLGA